MTRHLAQHLASSSGELAPMRLRHTVHLLQHGYHFGWLTIGFTILLFGLLIAAAVYRRGQSGRGQSLSAYRPTAAAPWQPSNVNQPPAAPWQSGIASSATPHYGQPVYASAAWTPSVSAPAWNGSQANNWPAPAAPQWTR
jgi:hypothetical protein